MIRWALALAWLASSAAACPPASETLLLHSCHAPLAPRLLLLPEASPPGPESGSLWAMTGAYTATDPRAGGARKPVGLFVWGGRVVNPNLARMDGVLTVDPAGRLQIQHRKRARLGGPHQDLTDPATRARFAAEAARTGVSVAQSHLLIVDGRVDVRPRADAPRVRRRILFTDGAGFGVWQSPGPMTLHEASVALAAAHAPRMALNLDMGGHDYCWRWEAGRTHRCGLLERADPAHLSNLLVFQGPDRSPRAPQRPK